MDIELALRYLLRFLSDQTRAIGRSKVVIGISGGVDSSLTAALAAKALQPQQVLGLLMPYRTSSPDSLKDAHAVVGQLGIESMMIEITPQVDAYFQQFTDVDCLRRGNKMARERMSILYDHAKLMDGLVLGSGNKTERLLGYTTLWGDMSCDLAPLGDLYKTEIFQLARAMSIPERIVSKPPSADLWPGQTDEEELGLTYAEVDRLLLALVERRTSRDQAVAEGFPSELVDRVLKLMQQAEHKRRMPPICLLPPEVRVVKAGQV